MKATFSKIFDNAFTIDLATINEKGYPEIRAMMNLRNAEIFPHLAGRFNDADWTFYLTTNAASLKIGQISANKKASIYATDPKTFEGVMMTGEVELETDKTVKNNLWHESFKMYYPAGKDDPDYTILRFTPRSYKYYDGRLKVHKGSMEFLNID